MRIRGKKILHTNRAVNIMQLSLCSLAVSKVNAPAQTGDPAMALRVTSHIFTQSLLASKILMDRSATVGADDADLIICVCYSKEKAYDGRAVRTEVDCSAKTR
jgi:hypothetical protein